MQYVCPKCGRKISNNPGKDTSDSIWRSAGIVGVLVAGAFMPYRCWHCGELHRSEFPPEVRAHMLRMQIATGVGAASLVGLIIFLGVKYGL